MSRAKSNCHGSVADRLALVGVDRPHFAAELLEYRYLLSASPVVLEAPWRGFDTGIFPQPFAPSAMALGDVDGDADADAVVSNDYHSGGGLSVLRSLGDGSLAPREEYDTSRPVHDIALTDADADGDLDVLATTSTTTGLNSELLLFRNDGDGTFGAPTGFAAGPSVLGLAIADFNGDGFPDAAVANTGLNSTTVSIAMHNGQTGAAAGFIAPVAVTVGQYPTSVVAGDLTGDGRPDLVVGRQAYLGQDGGVVSVLLNDGSGAFAAPVHYASSPGTNYGNDAAALGDTDRDGDLDLITSGYREGTPAYGVIVIRPNDGTGTFDTATFYNDEPYIFPMADLNTGDVNGDGQVDVLGTDASGRASDGYTVLLSDGSGGYAAAKHYATSQMPHAVAAADADGDGDQDVFAAAHSSAAVTVHENPGNGTFEVPKRYDAGYLVWGTDAADIDGDGDRDLVNSATNAIGFPGFFAHVRRNNGNGTFAPATVYDLPIGPRDVKFRDLNGDGAPDLLVGPNRHFPNYHFATALNNGDGTFAPAVRRLVYAAQEGTIEAADLDNDGDLDVVLTEEGTNIGGEQPHIYLFRNDGPQQFTEIPRITSFVGIPFGLEIADLKHDGNLDLISAVSQGAGVWIGNGDMTFQEPLVSAAPMRKFKLANLNGDANLDLALSVPQPAFGTVQVAVALGNGDGTFAAPADAYFGSSVLESLTVIGDVDTGDLDLDGDQDVIATNFASNDLSVFLNNGDGTLGAHQRFGVGINPRNTVVADVTGDGAPDVTTSIMLPPGGVPGALVVLPALPPAHANGIWTGAGDGTSWDDPANWSNSVLPDADDDVVINSSGEFTVSLSSPVTHVRSLTLGDTAESSPSLVLTGNGGHVLKVTGLSINGSSRLDLNDNDLILDYSGTSPLSAVQALINSARSGGTWTGNGLTSSSARTVPQHHTTLGAMESAKYLDIYGANATFAGQALDDTMVLVKYTYYGDADFNGQVDFDDYVRTDAGFNGGLGDWANGDFDGNGQVDFDDYVLIDLAFNSQDGSL